jgi:hypothetical protein
MELDQRRQLAAHIALGITCGGFFNSTGVFLNSTGLVKFDWLSKMRGAQAVRHCAGRPGRDG